MNDVERQINWILEDKYKGKWNLEILGDILRLNRGEPIDYVIGWKPFLECKIDLSKKPLIPRFETEFWTGKAIDSVNKRKGAVSVLDIFSGSGCIGTAVLKNCANAKVDFSELDKNLLAQIKVNLKLNGIRGQRYKIIHSNIFSKIKNRYDFIFANPPYIPLSRRKNIQKEVIKHEPGLALFGGKDGLSAILKFLKDGSKYLKSNGQIWMEFDAPQKKSIEKILDGLFYSSWTFGRDQYGRWRYVVINK